jgi:hypothetical protein
VNDAMVEDLAADWDVLQAGTCSAPASMAPRQLWSPVDTSTRSTAVHWATQYTILPLTARDG